MAKTFPVLLVGMTDDSLLYGRHIIFSAAEGKRATKIFRYRTWNQMLKRVFSFLGPKLPSEQAVALYSAIVAQARRPEFYRDFSVPDTLDGRFDMIVLHAILTLRRLGRIGEQGRALSQALFDLLFADMDSSLREIGVGDLSVGKKVKAMAQAFYGRADAYEAGLNSPAADALTGALARNLYGTAATPPDPALAAMAAYMRQADITLAAQEDEHLLAGKPVFPAPPGLTR